MIYSTPYGFVYFCTGFPSNKLYVYIAKSKINANPKLVFLIPSAKLVFRLKELSVGGWDIKRVEGDGSDPELGISDRHGEEKYDSSLENDEGYAVE
ncbi:hypothetical protein RHGRI_018857 [Rhododendron griersonianum]|uniref:Pyridoxamine 5'-phosphate oxidase putative domain-containing protein n=1 Tax=Rhododendron griersonianum TaxID=479676 RepID=A0AAV6K304_9ERIC|nr:hypothetical protein RHGRI_018857 [Rhododendron griersonianum]